MSSACHEAVQPLANTARTIWNTIRSNAASKSPARCVFTSAVRTERRSSASPMPTPASLRASASRSLGCCIGVDRAGPAMRLDSVPDSGSPASADCVSALAVSDSAGFGMSSGFTSPSMTWSEPSRPMVANRFGLEWLSLRLQGDSSHAPHPLQRARPRC